MVEKNCLTKVNVVNYDSRFGLVAEKEDITTSDAFVCSARARKSMRRAIVANQGSFAGAPRSMSEPALSSHFGIKTRVRDM